MKKIILIVSAVLAFLLMSCEGNKRCPAYDEFSTEISLDIDLFN